MELQNVKLIYWSATGNTRTVIREMGSVLGGVEVDLTDVAPSYAHTYSGSCLAVFAVPSFGGRVPANAAERIAQIHGNGTPAVIMTTFGNRAYDDTLTELFDIVTKNGFIVIAAAACVAQHSIAHTIAEGRPYISDKAEIRAFARDVAEKLRTMTAPEKEVPEIKGGRPYRAYGGVPLVPMPTAACTACGLCAEKCPAGAISRTDPRAVDMAKCMACMRCTTVCPAHARTIGKVKEFAAKRSIAHMCHGIAKNEFFL